jgi:YD repeat-containing protein
MNAIPKHLRARHRVVYFLLFTYLLTAVNPWGYASAQMSYFSKAGMGISRSPLQVTQFNAPGFGDLEQAINLATGGLFLSTDSLSANGVRDGYTASDYKWQFSPRLRLGGFSTTLSTAPSTFWLGLGDGSSSTFERVWDTECTTDASVKKVDYTKAASWIQRYQNADDKCNRIALYQLVPALGLSYAQEWVVFKPNATNAVAHYYDSDGIRHTFFADGEYADFSQTLHQQYVSAEGGDVNGTLAIADNKTEYKYEDVTEGRVASVSDAYGRTNTYAWADFQGSRVLKNVNFLVTDVANPATAFRTITLDYQTLPNSQAVVVKTITFNAPDGRDGVTTKLSRTLSFGYYDDRKGSFSNDYTTRIKSITETTAGGTKTTEYTYEVNLRYDKYSGDWYQVKTVNQTGQPLLTYDYSSISGEYGGTVVKITQTGLDAKGKSQEKRTEYHFDKDNKLRMEAVQDVNPVDTTNPRFLQTRYVYYGTGNLGLIENPAGEITHYTYDARGNIATEAFYSSRKFFDQDIFKPVIVSASFSRPNPAKSPDSPLVGLNEPFNITAKLERDLDPDRPGVRWYLVTHTSTGDIETPLTSNSRMKLGTVTKSETASDGSYTVTASIVAPGGFSPSSATAEDFTIRVRSVTNPGSRADVPVTTATRVQYLKFTRASNYQYLVSAPPPALWTSGCLRSREIISDASRNSWRNCSKYFDIGSHQLQFADWVSAPEKVKYSEVSYSIGSYGYSDLVPPTDARAPKINSIGMLEVPWIAELTRQTQPVNIVIRSKAEPSRVITVPFRVGFFGLTAVQGNPGDWDPLENDVQEYWDEGTYQYAVDTIHSPAPDLRVSWEASDSHIDFNHQTASGPLPAGCMYIKDSGWGNWNYWTSFTITARVYQFPLVKLDSSEHMAFFTARGGAHDFREECSTKYETGASYGSNGTLDGFGNSQMTNYDPLAPTTVSCPKGMTCLMSNMMAMMISDPQPTLRDPGEAVAEELQLPNTLQPNYERYTRYTYDADNRLDVVSQVSDLIGNIDGVNHGYKNVVEDFVYTDHPVAGEDGEIFTATNVAKRIVKLTAANQPNEVPRSHTDTYAKSGLLEKSELSWGDNKRVTNYAYYASGEEALATVPNSTLTLYRETPIVQFSDMPKSISVEAFPAPSNMDKVRTTYYVYDRIGNVTSENLAGVYSDFNGDSATSSQQPYLTANRRVERLYNGYGQQLWERVSSGGTTASEQGWLYHPTGELAMSWSGSLKNAVRYNYYGGDRAGLTSTMRKGVSNGVWTVTPSITEANSRLHLSYDYDGFSRLKSQKDEGANALTTYQYDTLDRVVEEVLPSGAATTTKYDLFGQVAERTSPLVVTKTQRYYNENPSRFMTVDTVTPVAREYADATYTTTTLYDPYGRVLSQSYDAGTINATRDDRTTVYRYDSEGNLLCAVGARLRTTPDPGALLDSRRSGVAYTYDGLGRKLTEAVVLYGDGGALRPLDSCAISGSETDLAKTSYAYTSFDDLYLITDAEGYTTRMTYDAGGRIASSTRMVTKATGGTAATFSTTRTVFDGAGRTVKVRDPLGNISQTTYDALGNVTAEIAPSKINTTGYTLKKYTYTADGLLSTIQEPDTSDGEQPTLKTPAAVLGSMVTTQINVYATKRPYPSSVVKATMDTQPSVNGVTVSAGAETKYVYDWAGRVTDSTLPDGTVVKQRYDQMGNLEELTDADGFVTTYDYDYANRLIGEHKAARATSNGVTNADSDAGLSAGLTSSYKYDVFGNLTEQTKQGVKTRFVYNSLGKVVAESLPQRDSFSTNYKKYAYRLDGQRVAVTSYDYVDGSLANDQKNMMLSGVTTFGGGSVQSFVLDALGNVIEERLQGYREGSLAPGLDKEVKYTRNGLNLVTKRDLVEASSDIFAGLRYPDGKAIEYAGVPQTNYVTIYRYSPRGELLHRWDEITPDGGATFRANEFSYTYTASGKEATAERTLVAKVERDYNTATGTTVTEPVVLAGSDGSVTNTYNERDLLMTSKVDDKAVKGNTLVNARFVSTTWYNYFHDGSRAQEKVDSPAYPDNDPTVTFTYDTRGRVKTTVDSNGAIIVPEGLDDDGEAYKKHQTVTQLESVGAGSATTTTTYEGDKVIKTVAWTACTFTETTTYALGQFQQKQETTNTCGGQGSLMKYEYDVYGQLVKTTGNNKSRTYSGTDKVGTILVTTTIDSRINQYDSFGNVEKTTEKSTFASPAFEFEVTYTQVHWSPKPGAPSNTYCNGPTGGHCYATGTSEQTTTIRVPAKTTDSLTVTNNTYTVGGNAKTETTEKRSKERAKTSNHPNAEYVTTPDWSVLESPTFNGAKTYNAKTYQLDSQGNRLAVSEVLDTWDDQGVPQPQAKRGFDGYTKRYNADGQVSSFFRYASSYVASYSDFFYDPKGNLVLSSSAGVSQDASAKKPKLIRDYNSTYYSNGEVQLIRKRWLVNEDSLTEQPDKQSVKDRTFSMADGIGANTKWEAVVLFNATAPAEGQTTLEAPVEALSTTLQIDPMDVVAPSETAPTPLGNTDEVTPPADTEEVTSSDSSNEVVSSETGITTLMTGQALTAQSSSSEGDITSETVPTGGELADGSTTPVSTSDASLPGQTDTLAAPTSALPGSITSVDAQDVGAPETTPTTGFSAPSSPTVSETTPDEVVSPDAGITSPNVGTTPQDGPLDVVMPEELTASVPTVGGDVPAPIESVTPPVGWSPEGDVGAFGGIDTITESDCAGSNADAEQCGGPTVRPETVGQAGAGTEFSIDADTGGSITIDPVVAPAFMQAYEQAFDSFLEHLKDQGLNVTDEELAALADIGASSLVGSFFLAIASAPENVQTALLQGLNEALATEDLEDVITRVDDVFANVGQPWYDPVSAAVHAFTPYNVALGPISIGYQPNVTQNLINAGLIDEYEITTEDALLAAGTAFVVAATIFAAWELVVAGSAVLSYEWQVVGPRVQMLTNNVAGLWQRQQVFRVANLVPIRPVNIRLRFEQGMQRQGFNNKTQSLQTLSDSGVLFKAANPVTRDRTIADAYRQDLIKRIWTQYGTNNPQFANRLIDRVTDRNRMHIDHPWDLQLGGMDVTSNMKMLHSFTNEALGRQVWNQIRNLPTGTPITITID